MEQMITLTEESARGFHTASEKWKRRHSITIGKAQFDEENIVELTEVLCIPRVWNNLFSLTAEIGRGAQLTNRGKVLVLKFPDHNEFVFDCLIHNTTGYVTGAMTSPVGIDITIDKDDLIKTSRDEFHKVCGHQWG